VRILLLGSILLLLVSCSGNHPVENAGAAVPSADTSVSQLLKIIEGGWVNEDYIRALEKYRSPMDAAKAGLPVREMAFDISQLEGDTLVNALGRIGYNEDQHFDVIFVHGANGSLAMKIGEHKNYQQGELTLSYAIEEKDTLLLLDIRNGNSTQVFRFRREFRLFPETGKTFYTALEHYVNRRLFAGNWELDGQTVSFDATGSVKNFRNFKRYSVTTDTGYPDSRPDEISFYGDSSGVTMTFTLREGILDLYELHDSEDGLSFSRGKLLARLRRK
jgi:hypothetical protein